MTIDFVLNRDVIQSAMAKKRIRGLSDLARRTGVHRNTLGRFIYRQLPVLPDSIARVFEELSVSPGDALKRIGDPSPSSTRAIVAEIADKLLAKHHEAAYVLFGSRARNDARKYSDFDIGVFSKDGLPLEKYLSLLDIKGGFEEDQPWFFDLVNLNNADSEFLKNIGPDLQFLAGRHGDWLALKAKCCNEQ